MTFQLEVPNQGPLVFMRLLCIYTINPHCQNSTCPAVCDITHIGFEKVWGSKSPTAVPLTAALFCLDSQMLKILAGASSRMMCDHNGHPTWEFDEAVSGENHSKAKTHNRTTRHDLLGQAVETHKLSKRLHAASSFLLLITSDNDPLLLVASIFLLSSQAWDIHLHYHVCRETSMLSPEGTLGSEGELLGMNGYTNVRSIRPWSGVMCDDQSVRVRSLVV